MGASPTRQPLQPEATGAVMEVTKWLKPSVSMSRYTVTAQSNAGRNASERRASLEKDDAQADLTAISGKADTTGGEVSEAVPPVSHCAEGSGDSMYTGKRTQHGKPQGVVREDQPGTREGRAGRPGVAERFVVPRKPGNAGGGKGPQFKTDARRSEGPGDWVTYQLRKVFRNCRRRCTRKRRQKPATASTPCTTRSTGRTS